MLRDPSEGRALRSIAVCVLANGLFGSGEQIERQLYPCHVDLVPILQYLLSHDIRAVDEQRLRAVRRADGITLASLGDSCSGLWGKPAGQPNGRSFL